MRVRYTNGLGEVCESPEYARFVGSDQREYVVVHDWRLRAERILLADEVVRISGGEDLGVKADLERVDPAWREALVEELVDEVNDMSTKELAFLLLEGMDQAELDERVRELQRDFPDSAVTCH